jgi:hypothetical protein
MNWLLLFLAVPQSHRPFRFTNEAIEKGQTNYQRVAIYRAQSNSVVWTQDIHTPSGFYPHWSPDGHRLAWLDRSWHVYVWDWKRGEKEFLMPNPFQALNMGNGEPPGFDNYPMWSPDSKSFLLKVPGAQGNFDLLTGTLIYVDPAREKTSIISWVACEVRWKSARTVEYWEKFYHELPRKPTVKHHLWHVRLDLF